MQKYTYIAASIIGRKHYNNKIPKQDEFYIKRINDHSGVFCICDGIGSALHSDIGAKFVAQTTCEYFFNLAKRNEWPKKLPKEKKWKRIADEGLYKIHKDLEIYLKSKAIQLADAACTLILVIYSNKGILISHIGDGRSAYLSEKKKLWLPIMTPYIGEYVGSTIAITNKEIFNLKFRDKFIESKVIEDKPLAIVSMTDGLEKASFKCYQKNAKGQTIRANIPYQPFLTPITSAFKSMVERNIPRDTIQQKFINFLKEGNDALSKEMDDKTIVLVTQINS